MIDRALLERTELLKGLPEAVKTDLAARAVLRRFAKGQRLWTAGAQPRGLFVILAGQVRIVRQPGRRQHVVHSEGPGATIGEIPLFGGGTYPATAIAAAQVECLVIDRGALSAAMTAHPELAWALLARLAQRVRHLLDRLSAQTADPVRDRLVAYLAARPRGADGAISLGQTQEHVAEEIGTVREVVVRLLRTLVEEKRIARRGRGVYVILGPLA